MAMGWSQRQPDGRWRYFATHGSGPARVTANAIRDTKREAKSAAEARLDAKLRSASFPESRLLTLAEFLTRYSAHYATHSDSAWGSYLYQHWSESLPRELARKRLADLSPALLQLWVDSLTTDHAPSTVRKEYQNLSTALARAVDWGLIPVSPMVKVRCPKQERADRWIPDEAETVALLDALKGTRLHAVGIVAVTTGLRRGELCALRWQDVDGTSLKVERAAEWDRVNGQVRFKVPKTASSRRTVALLDWTQAALKEHRAEQVAARLKAKAWTEHGLVFPRRDGSPWPPPSLSGAWSAAKTGVRLHDLRHAHATHLLRAGVPVPAVSRRLGHANPAITMRVYAWALTDDDSVAVERLGERFASSDK